MDKGQGLADTDMAAKYGGACSSGEAPRFASCFDRIFDYLAWRGGDFVLGGWCRRIESLLCRLVAGSDEYCAGVGRKSPRRLQRIHARTEERQSFFNRVSR